MRTAGFARARVVTASLMARVSAATLFRKAVSATGKCAFEGRTQASVIAAIMKATT